MRRGDRADGAAVAVGLFMAALGALVALLGADAVLGGETGPGLAASAIGWGLFSTGLVLAGGSK